MDVAFGDQGTECGKPDVALMEREEPFLPLLASIPQVFRALSSDGLLLFVTRSVRMFAYGFLSLVLVYDLWLDRAFVSHKRDGKAV